MSDIIDKKNYTICTIIDLDINSTELIPSMNYILCEIHTIKYEERRNFSYITDIHIVWLYRYIWKQNVCTKKLKKVLIFIYSTLKLLVGIGGAVVCVKISLSYKCCWLNDGILTLIKENETLLYYTSVNA